MSRADPPPEGLRERNKREKLTRIKRVALQLFEKKGFEATTAREICQRARIGTGTLFLYVQDKRELLFLVFQEEAQRLFAQGMERAAADSTSLVDSLMCLFEGFIEFYARNPELSKALLQELFFHRHDKGGMGELTSEYIEHIADLIRRAQERGEVRRELEPSAAASACFAHYAFWLQAWLGARMVSPEEVRGKLRAALELQMEGLRARRTRQKKTPRKKLGQEKSRQTKPAQKKPGRKE